MSRVDGARARVAPVRCVCRHHQREARRRRHGAVDANAVDDRREWPISKILDEWDDYGPQCEAICQHFGGAEVQWLSDMTTHEHDIRGALGQPGERDSEAVRVGFTWLAQRLGEIGKNEGCLHCASSRSREMQS